MRERVPETHDPVVQVDCRAKRFYILLLLSFFFLSFVVTLPSRVYCPPCPQTRPVDIYYMYSVIYAYEAHRGVQKLMSVVFIFTAADKLTSRFSKSFARRRRRHHVCGDRNRQSRAAESLLRIYDTYNYNSDHRIAMTGTSCQTPITSIIPEV